MADEDRRPVAMFRGIHPSWHLYTGSPGEHLEAFYGDHSAARARAVEWCDTNGYYLSSWSDADDRRVR